MAARSEISPPTLRRAQLADMASIARLRRAAFFRAMPHMPVLHTPEEDGAYFSAVVFPQAEVWLCEQQAGIAAGFIAFRPGWVDHLYIHPDHQGLGLGRKLLKVVQESESEIRLWTFQCNARARRFYERNGFKSEFETDGANNEERQPDVLYFWKKTESITEPFLPERVTLSPVTVDDFEALAALRIAAMRESLERVGRFDPQRARERLRQSFYPEHTHWIEIDGERVGFYTWRPADGAWQLDHLYVHPKCQSRGVGSWVMRRLLAEADASRLPIRLGALRESAANRFYQRHGFVLEREEEWDLYYVRPPG